MNRQERRRAERERRKSARNGGHAASFAAGAPLATVGEALGQGLARAVELHRAGDLDGAERLYRQVLRQDPSSLDALNLLSKISLYRGNLTEAKALAERAAAIAPGEPDVQMSLCDVLAAGGDLDGAAEAARNAVKSAPRSAEARARLARALLANDATPIMVQEAASHLEIAASLKPDWPVIHYDLGTALWEAGDVDGAVKALRKAIEMMPEHARSHALLGRALLEIGRGDEAIQKIDRAIELAPDDPNGWLKRAEVLSRLGDAAGLAAAASKATQLAPNDPGVVHRYLVSMMEVGRTEEATDAAAELIRISPDSPEALGVASLATKSDEAAGLLERIENAFKGDLRPAQRYFLHFGAAEALDKLDRVDESFAHYLEGNKILDSAAASNTDYSDWLDRVEEVFTRDFIAERAAFGCDSEEPVFVVGMPRSGTTLTEELLARHPDIHGAGELDDLSAIARNLARMIGSVNRFPENAAEMSALQSEGIAREYLRRRAIVSNGAKRVIDKMPLNFLFLGLIQLLFPRAHVLHCRRDPMDTCTSIFMKDYPQYDFANDMEKLGRFYRRYEAEMTHWRESLPLRIMDIEYESLVREPEKNLREIVSFIGLEWDDALLDFGGSERVVRTASLTQVREPIYDRAIGRWKRWEKHLGPLKAALDTA